MVIGSTCASQFVDNANFAAVDGIVTLLATRDDAQISFVGSGSTFTSLNVKADNGVVVKVDILTDIITASIPGTMYLDGDSEDSSKGNGVRVPVHRFPLECNASEFLF